MITALLVAISVALALGAAVGAGWLARGDGMTIQRTIMCGCGAFAGTLTLLLFVLDSCSAALVPGLLVGLAGLMASIVAVGAAWLARSDGTTVQRAILLGGGAFAGAMTRISAGVVRLGRQVVVQRRGLHGEPVAGQLHPVAGVIREADDHLILSFDATSDRHRHHSTY